MNIIFKLTTRGRPELAIRTIDSIKNNAIIPDYFILVSVDEDDKNTIDKLNEYLRYVPMSIMLKGKKSNKIEAINRDVNSICYNWDILVNVSDDQVFVKKGFDVIIKKNFHIGYADPYYILPTNLDQFIHFPDGNQDNLATMSIIGRDYYERDNYIYHPSYVSVYADNEAQDVSIQRGCYKFVNEIIAHHLHPAWGKANNDELYLKNESPTLYNQDGENYKKRKSNNFKD